MHSGLTVFNVISAPGACEIEYTVCQFLVSFCIIICQPFLAILSNLQSSKKDMYKGVGAYYAEYAIFKVSISVFKCVLAAL